MATITAAQAREIANNSDVLKVRTLDALFASVKSAAEDGRFMVSIPYQSNEMVKQYLISELTAAGYKLTYSGQDPTMITWTITE